MSFHREQKEKELREAGVAPEAAHHAAAREFGNATRLKEQSHEVVGFRFETVWQDLHFALRQLRRSPGFTLTAVLDAGAGDRRERGDLCVCRCCADQAAALSGPDAAGRCDMRRAKMFPRSNLSYQDYRRLEEDEQGLQRAGGLHGNGLSDEYAFGGGAGAGCAGERWVLSGAGGEARAGPRFLRRRGSAGRGRYGDPDLRRRGRSGSAEERTLLGRR